VSLKAYIDSRKDQTPALWVSMKAPYQQLQTHALENIVKKVGERTGVHAYPHKLRHTFATVGLRNGIPLDKLQVLMGHANPRTTLIYADQDKDQVHMEHVKAFS
jgi:integrase/recombinase XerD